MMNVRGSLRLGVARVAREEASKAALWVKYGAAAVGNMFRGHNGMTEQEIERDGKLREQMRSDAAKAAQAAPAPRTLSDYVSLLRQACSSSAGAAAIVDHCTRAHAAAVAVEQGIDVKSVNVVAEKAAVGEGTRIVGYIEAPAASDEEVMVFAQRLQKACPAAKMHGDIEWRRR